MITEKKKDFGVITFGAHKGKNWNDLPRDYLEYLVSDECNTTQANKDRAREVLIQYHVIDGQGLLFPRKEEDVDY